MDTKTSLNLFKKNWYIIFDLNSSDYQFLKTNIENSLLNLDGITQPIDINQIHEQISNQDLNKQRIKLIQSFNKIDNLKKRIIDSAKDQIDSLIGNELAIQKNINLNIQIPHDESSHLPVHSDVWAGNSPFELVLWIPFCDVYKSKSLFLLPKEKSLQYSQLIANDPKYSIDNIANKEKGSLIWPELKEGQAILFSHSLLHGNQINEENETRLSMNLRLKSLFTPYSTKGLGEFFEVYNMKPVNEIGLELSQSGN
ncbi:MAG: 2OG-Fe(II) oxygenase [Bacteriovoracaceae bacterium]|nr:2OG-Fe(II) oxygenase [Bacteriovoracaceae bacterium]